MKTFSKTITSLSLSLLSIGVMGQSQSSAPSMLYKPFKAPSLLSTLHQKYMYAPNSRVTGNVANMEVNYFNNDANFYGADYTYTGDPINARYNHTDTDAHYNYDLLTNAIVAFDTLIDENTIGYSAAAGSMEIDTIWASCWYKNTSNTNDTLLFRIDSVTPTGYPTTKIYTTDTVILHKDDTLTAATPSGNENEIIPGYSTDSLTQVWAVPNFTLPRNHTKFCINTTFLGSKVDTFVAVYGYPFGTCSNNNYTNAFTQYGYTFTSNPTKKPRTINVNSYNIGYQLDYGSNTLLPKSDGTIFDGFTLNGNNVGNYNYADGLTVCGDTIFFPEQDYWIFPSVTFNITTATGINNLVASGLSVGQNYPNPFNKQTQITYSLTQSSAVTFTVYDITGRVIMTTNYSTVAPGQHEINLSANSFSPGIYFYTFNVSGSTVTKKMVITD